MSRISIVKSNKNKEMLSVDGYFYYLEKITKKGSHNWSCSKRKMYHCKSRLVTIIKDNIHCITKKSGVHSHSPEAKEKPVRDANLMLKESAKKNMLPTYPDHTRIRCANTGQLP